jgi:hypothetical protein
MSATRRSAHSLPQSFLTGHRGKLLSGLLKERGGPLGVPEPVLGHGELASEGCRVDRAEGCIVWLAKPVNGRPTVARAVSRQAASQMEKDTPR